MQEEMPQNKLLYVQGDTYQIYKSSYTGETSDTVWKRGCEEDSSFVCFFVFLFKKNIQ